MQVRKSLRGYLGYFFTLSGGFFLGFGIAIIIISRMVVEIFGTAGDPIAFSNMNLASLFMICLGLVGSEIGIFLIHSSQIAESPKSAVIQSEKKFCQYCRTENKIDAVFCQKCGEKID